MAQPAATVRFLNSLGGMKGRGANLLDDSQNGKATKHTAPTTTMAIILALLQPPFARCARVQGMRISAKAADKSSNPIMSSSYQRFLVPEKKLCPAHGDGGSRPSFFAFLMFRISAKARGKKDTGSTIVQMP